MRLSSIERQKRFLKGKKKMFVVITEEKYNELQAVVEQSGFKSRNAFFENLINTAIANPDSFKNNVE